MPRQHSVTPGNDVSPQSGGKTTCRRRNRKLAKDQSTLTQLHAVLFPDGRQATEIVGISSDDELYQESRPKKRRRTATKVHRRDDTLTQRHGFTRSASSFECGDSDEEIQQVEAQHTGSAAERVNYVKGRNKARMAQNTQPTNLMPDQNTNIQMKGLPEDEKMLRGARQLDFESTGTHHRPTNVNLRTPRKSVRFATEQVIPSSQTPSDAGICSQRSTRYQDFERSPLKERSRNPRIATPGCSKQSDTKNGSGSVASSCKTSLGTDQDAMQAIFGSLRHDKCAGAVLSEKKDNKTKSAEPQISSDDASRAQEPQKSLPDPDDQGIRSENMVAGTEVIDRSRYGVGPHMKSEITSQCTRRRLTFDRTHDPVKVDTFLVETKPSPKEYTSSKTKPEESVITSRSQSRGSLQRVSTIQDSDSEACEFDEAEQESIKKDDEIKAEGDDFTQFTFRNPSTYDPVNSALDRDAARFLRTQRTQSQRRQNARAQTPSTQPTLLLDQSTVGDSDDMDDAIVAGEEDSADGVTTKVVPKPLAPLLGKPSTIKIGAKDGPNIESQCTVVASDTLLELVGVPDSQTQTETQAPASDVIEDEHSLIRANERSQQESTGTEAVSEICDFAPHAAAVNHPSTKVHPPMPVQESTHTETKSKPQLESVASDVTEEVVLSSQPNERRFVVHENGGRADTETNQVAASPAIVRSSQISTVVPTQWSQRGIDELGLQSTSCVQEGRGIAASSQTVPSSPILYPWTSSHGDKAAHYTRLGRFNESYSKDSYGEAQPVDWAEFSLAPPPEWQPGILTMSSSPIVAPPKCSSLNTWQVQKTAE
nr:hypothetical protein CFP56_56057 [Quercus suber]